ncbi:MAG: response regulator [Marinicellaceae bacterium]
MLFSISSVFANDYDEIGLPVTEVFDSFAHKGANQNWWMAQAKNGLIYNGTGTGLNEWDGERWAIYKTPQKSRIRSLSIWKDDNIYVGTNNDIGYYYANDLGSLTYQSLLDDWTFEEKQFGEVWSVASNTYGVVFTTNKYLLFWDGQTIQKLDALVGSHRIFSLDEQFYFKANNDKNLYTIKFNPNIIIEKTDIIIDENIIIRNLFKNNNNNLTMVTATNGIYEIINNQVTLKLAHEVFQNDTNIYNSIQAHDGYYYLTSLFNGLYIVDEHFKLVKHYTQEHGLGTNTLLSVIEDYQQNIWISGVPNIIKMVPPHAYSQYKTDNDSRGSEWITILNQKVTALGDGVGQLQKSQSSLGPAFFKNIADSNNSAWGAIIYENHFLYAASGGVFAMQYDENKNLLPAEIILKTDFAKFFKIDVDTNILYASTEEGLFRIKYIDGQWQTQIIQGTEDEVHYIAIENSIIWTGTSTQELYKIENAHDDLVETTVTKFIDKDGLGANNVIPFNTSMGVLFGTNDGLMDYQNTRTPQLQFLEYLPDVFHTENMDVFRFYEDAQQNFWYRIGNRTGYLNKNANGQWQTNEDLFKYFPDSGYKGFVKSDSNTLWFNMANGEIFRANIDRIKNIPIKTEINIRKIVDLDTQIEIFGGLGSPKLPALTQQNNSIRIYFALADNSIANAVNANMVQYRHRLHGSNHPQFSEWTTENHKDFTLLRGNDYEFEVEAKDAWGRISSNSIRFKVLPPWFLSSTAWTIYAVIALLVLFISSWLTQKWRTKKLHLRNLKLEKIIQERTADVQEKANALKQQQEIKDRFFSNVSHEFRTPLTLTIAPLKAFLEDNKSLDENLLHPINTALRNSQKMLTLVSQVLDINRLESGRFPLRVFKNNISELINNTVNRFKILAKQQNQYLIAANTEEIHSLYYDPDQIDKCLSNLIANAIKYSGKNSLIEISLVIKETKTGIKVSDNGKGISPSYENKIFDRYTQDENAHNLTEPGTGIGLAFVKELIELHHGNVELINQPNQECTFIMWLKHGNSHFSQTQLQEPVSQKTHNISKEDDLLVSNKIKHSSEVNSQDKTTILIVDDNQELREFMVSRLSSYYRIIQASNGQEGLALAQSALPDLIISDVMMPIMDGLELTKKIKSFHLTKSIPIILLTAQSSKRSTVTGLQSGADDYMTKPFDTSELILRAIRLINGVKQIRESIQEQLTQNLTKLDKRSHFVEKLHLKILDQMSNPKLNVDSLTSSMAMSRSSLNRKCKSELDKTTNQVITDIRMQHAMQLIKLDKHSITEIAYGTGYESLAYFSRLFKKHYGETPSNIRKG